MLLVVNSSVIFLVCNIKDENSDNSNTPLSVRP